MPATFETPDDAPTYDGDRTTIAQRFRTERLRWEAETGGELATIPGFSKNIIRAIEEGVGGVRKGARLEYLTYAGIDVLYVMTGHRTMTPVERGIRDSYRTANAEQRQALLLRAAALVPASGQN